MERERARWMPKLALCLSRLAALLGDEAAPSERERGRDSEREGESARERDSTRETVRERG